MQPNIPRITCLPIVQVAGTILYSALCRIIGFQQNIPFRQIAKIWVSVYLYPPRPLSRPLLADKDLTNAATMPTSTFLPSHVGVSALHSRHSGLKQTSTLTHCTEILARLGELYAVQQTQTCSIYRAGRPIIRKVLKTIIWVVPPVCLGSMQLQQRPASRGNSPNYHLQNLANDRPPRSVVPFENVPIIEYVIPLSILTWSKKKQGFMTSPLIHLWLSCRGATIHEWRIEV